MPYLSHNKAKLVRGLARRKVRDQERCFLAEGEKIVAELLDPARHLIPHETVFLCAVRDWLEENTIPPSLGSRSYTVNAPDLARLSGLKSPPRVMAVVRQAEYPEPGELPRPGMALDCIQDPGNLGTLLRTADWFGIRDIWCSTDTADLYNPKVVQASMGSFLRVRVHYTLLRDLLIRRREAGNHAIYATAAGGSDLYREALSGNATILLGNESRGLAPELVELADRLISIPASHPEHRPESLNVAAAAAVICGEIRRQQKKP